MTDDFNTDVLDEIEEKKGKKSLNINKAKLSDHEMDELFGM